MTPCLSFIVTVCFAPMTALLESRASGPDSFARARHKHLFRHRAHFPLKKGATMTEARTRSSRAPYLRMVLYVHDACTLFFGGKWRRGAARSRPLTERRHRRENACLRTVHGTVCSEVRQATEKITRPNTSQGASVRQPLLGQQTGGAPCTSGCITLFGAWFGASRPPDKCRCFGRAGDDCGQTAD